MIRTGIVQMAVTVIEGICVRSSVVFTVTETRAGWATPVRTYAIDIKRLVTELAGEYIASD